MKRILIIIIAISFFASCKKCAECTTTTSVSPALTGYPKTGIPIYACDDDLKYWDDRTDVYTFMSNGTTYTVTSKTVCK
jgi:hypothetical protein